MSFFLKMKYYFYGRISILLQPVLFTPKHFKIKKDENVHRFAVTFGERVKACQKSVRKSFTNVTYGKIMDL